MLGLLPAAASHLVGGELTYKYIDNKGPAGRPHRYEVTALIYYDSGTRPVGDAYIPLAISTKDAPGNSVLFTNVVRYSYQTITAPPVPGCSLQGPPVTLAMYVTGVSLPASTAGYVASYTVGNRNAGITNLLNSSQQYMTLSVDMTPPTIPNYSPAFSDNALFVVCQGDTTTVINNAYDVDGDRLSYRFATPNSFTVGSPAIYAPGYSAPQPFGTSGFVNMDARTGVATYLGMAQGTYLMAIDVDEYRTINGKEVLLGTLRRDVHVVVRACSGPGNKAPVFSRTTLAQKDFQVEEGQPLNFDITATDPEGQPIGMNVSSVLLDGNGGVDATLNGQTGTGSLTNPLGSAAISGPGIVTGAFRLRTACGMARATPYDVVVTVADYGCGSKTTGTVYRVFVHKPVAPSRVLGDSVLCAESVANYTVSGPARNAYRWRVQGGQLLGPAGGPTVQVRWTAPGAGTLTVQGISATGCLTDSVVRAVAVGTGPPVEGPAAYCRTANANTGLRYAVAGPPAAYQWSITNGTLVSGQGTNEVRVDVAPGAVATLQVSGAGAACPTVQRISPDDSCLFFYNIITPNADGRNDVFTIENVERHPGTALTVFNRWGQQIYHSPDYRNTYGGEGQGPGVYYYRCLLADGTAYKGWFELVR
ncbi:hypothetical protein GCM10027511_16700 [Hymenobacter humi]